MYHSQFFFFLLLVSLVMRGQELIEKPVLNLPGYSKWEYDAFSYADFGMGEEHSYFSILYRPNSKLHTELQGFYDTYRSADVFDVSLRVKWYPTKKVYLFTGVGAQIQRVKVGDGVPIMPLRMLNGVGYQPNQNSTIEAVHNLNFNKNIGGQNASPSLFRFMGKYRF